MKVNTQTGVFFIYIYILDNNVQSVLNIFMRQGNLWCHVVIRGSHDM